jgi:UDP-glucose 4-epimerase
MAKIAVIGATSYEGRQMLLSLKDRGMAHQGFEEATVAGDHAGDIETVPFENSAALTEAFHAHGITDVIHLPHRGTVANSLKDPLEAFTGTLRPLMITMEAVRDAGVERVVLSSTASVYGTPQRIPVSENAPLAPISPLGAAAVAAERLTTDACRGYQVPFVILRYFNAAGADPLGRAARADAPKHLITAAVHVALGKREGPLMIYGDDYGTPDGTAIRDYVHVADVATAHLDAVEHLRRGGRPVILNCGYGEGASVMDVIRSIERATGEELGTEVRGRREGDPPQLIADTALIRSLLGWRPQYDDLDLIIRTAIDWERAHGTEPVAAQ